MLPMCTLCHPGIELGWHHVSKLCLYSRTVLLIPRYHVRFHQSHEKSDRSIILVSRLLQLCNLTLSDTTLHSVQLSQTEKSWEMLLQWLRDEIAGVVNVHMQRKGGGVVLWQWDFTSKCVRTLVPSLGQYFYHHHVIIRMPSENRIDQVRCMCTRPVYVLPTLYCRPNVLCLPRSHQTILMPQ